MGVIKEYCNRVIWIDNGYICVDSRDIDKVVDEYM